MACSEFTARLWGGNDDDDGMVYNGDNSFGVGRNSSLQTLLGTFGRAAVVFVKSRVCINVYTL